MKAPPVREARVSMPATFVIWMATSSISTTPDDAIRRILAFQFRAARV